MVPPRGAPPPPPGGEFQPDVPSSCADALAQTDLPGSLGDRNEHDVHDADAADQEGYADDSGEHAGGDELDLSELAKELVLFEDSKIVGLARA